MASAPQATTFLTTDAKLNREELANVVDMTERDKTPVYTLIGRGSCSSTSPQWAVDELEAPGQNIQPEGREYDYAAIAPAQRLQNYTQIFEKTGQISGTQIAVDKAGNHENVARQKIKKGVEIKRDVEYSILAANPSLPGASRQSGSLSTWAETNVSRGAGGANGGYDQATGRTVAPTNGTRRDLTRAMVDSVVRQGYESGADITNAFMTPGAKEVFATFLKDDDVIQLRSAVAQRGKVELLRDVDVYRGPLGLVNVIPNYVMGLNATLDRNMFILDTSKIKWVWMKGRGIREVGDLPKTGDKVPFVIEGEGTLMVGNEKAVGVIADLNSPAAA